MSGRVVRGLALLVLGGAMLGLLWLIGMRNKDSVVVAAQRRVNKAVFNPRQLKRAGTPGAYAGIVRHVGRSSGRNYETPVGIEPTAVGFTIALVYGQKSDWVQNVLAAGSAAIVHEGHEYAVDSPEVVPFEEAMSAFGEDSLASLRLVGVNDCLRVRRADAA
jgi:hypothetical protein